MYVPKAKREYGYYVLPVLRGDRIVGRIEPRFDRKTKTLEYRQDTSRAAALESRILAPKPSFQSRSVPQPHDHQTCRLRSDLRLIAE
jgi:hypothetical protein